MNNTITAYDGQEVYLSEMHRLADEYTADMDDEKAQQPQVFTAMLNYIYRNLFMPTKANLAVYERNRGTARQNSILPYDNIELLNEIWNTYVDLAVRYSQYPTLLDYSVLTGIDKDTLTCWENGSARGKSEAHMRTVKSWKTQCESTLARRTVQSNSIGSIFALKSNYGWRENDPVTPEPLISERRQSVEEIVARYEHVPLPEKPNLNG